MSRLTDPWDGELLWLRAEAEIPTDRDGLDVEAALVRIFHRLRAQADGERDIWALVEALLRALHTAGVVNAKDVRAQAATLAAETHPDA